MLKPRITEKSMMHAEGLGEYSFIVPSGFTKDKIRTIVEKTFGVKVARVRTKTAKGKTRRFGKRRNVVSLTDQKTAIVKLKDNAKIELFDLKENK
jgi:ribosomal protein L23